MFDGEHKEGEPSAILLTTHSVYGARTLDDMPIDERFKGLARDFVEKPIWRSFQFLLKEDGDHVRYADLAKLPNGIFHDWGMHREVISEPVTASTVDKKTRLY